jgi:hypothetical protein
MSKGCARSSKKGCGGRAAGRAVRIDEHSGVIRAPSGCLIRTSLDVWATRLGMAKFNINNFESATLVGSLPPKVLTVFQIGLQYLTTMDHRMKESFYG